MIAASAEYAAARGGAIVVERDDRVQLRAHGRDPVRMIQGLITNDLAGAPADRAVYASLLTPKGRMIADVRAIRQPDGSVLLDIDAGALEGALAHLRKMTPPLFARFEPPPTALRTIGVYGPDAAARLRAIGIDARDDAAEDDVLRAERDGAPVLVVATRHAGVEGFDLLSDASHADALVASLADSGAMRAGPDTLELLRVEAGRPRWGAELSEERIPLEAGLLERAISTSKGCYTGQEVIIRILHRGHVNWTLRGLLLHDVAAPAPGTELVAAPGGKAVARITSAIESPALQQTIALAYTRREVEPGAVLHLPGGENAIVVELPFTRVEAEVG